MAENTSLDNAEIVALARALDARIGALSAAADEAVRGIEDDRRRISGDAEGQASSDELISVVVERVEAIAADCSRLSGILHGFESLAGEAPAPETNAPPAHPQSRSPAPPPGYSPTPIEAVPSGGIRVSEGIRLLATQMSIAGASNGEIARRLHDAFGVENADVLVVELFGPIEQDPEPDTKPEAEAELEPEQDVEDEDEDEFEAEPDPGDQPDSEPPPGAGR